MVAVGVFGNCGTYAQYIGHIFKTRPTDITVDIFKFKVDKKQNTQKIGSVKKWKNYLIILQEIQIQ